MAMPRFLYSVNTSILKTPLLNESTSDELELALSADLDPTPEEDSDKFNQEVQLSPIEIEKAKPNIYTPARLPVAGITDPVNEEDDPINEDDDQLQLLSVSSRGYAVNAPEGGEVSRGGYGVYKEFDYQRKSSLRPSSTGKGGGGGGYGD